MQLSTGNKKTKPDPSKKSVSPNMREEATSSQPGAKRKPSEFTIRKVQPV